ncbi:MAG: hypothetical protein FJ049_00140 [Cyanobacteria bacterium M_surface_7_m2_037]|nr:hypothetical protein [Cyanobacteria bacterium M_surface_7_m2_037]
MVPISLPLTTGAGTISTITVYANSASSFDHRAELLAAILVMALIIALMFLFAARLTMLLPCRHDGVDQGHGPVHSGDRHPACRDRLQHDA